MPGWQRKRPVVPQSVDIAEQLQEMEQDLAEQEYEAAMQDAAFHADYMAALEEDQQRRDAWQASLQDDPDDLWADDFYRGSRTEFGDPAFDAFDPFDDFFDYDPDPFGIYEDASWRW